MLEQLDNRQPCVVRALVEMLAPYKGRVYDPCRGSAGMFVQSEKFVEEHGGRRCLATISFCFIGTFAKLVGWNSRNSSHSTALMATSGIGLPLRTSKLAICQNSIAVDSLQSPTREAIERFQFGNVTSQTFGDDFAQPYRNGIANESPEDIKPHSFSIFEKAIRLWKGL